MNIEHTKCPNCGGTVFSQPVSGSNQPASTVDCKYCGSQFRVRNPNYQPEPVVHTTINTFTANYTNITEPSQERSSGWRNAKNGEHKVARTLGYVVGGLMVPFVIGMWVAVLNNVPDLPMAVPVIFTGLMLFFFFLARMSTRELKRRGL
ncbi:hypothetical protein ACTJJ0_32230 [Chitinophaga sp. 22321]|uniref:MJ0042 family finger-like domain-containing protein n=1 Tax=Chitinophaga hostae TaxID=2831022 RepID=A0ABS5IXP6_9BACT|nr:hypothetical protein [Chitinophaga hostae]MBS0027613.1 hypothetical protein [Chitinophaga hostae]